MSVTVLHPPDVEIMYYQYNYVYTYILIYTLILTNLTPQYCTHKLQEMHCLEVQRIFNIVFRGLDCRNYSFLLN